MLTSVSVTAAIFEIQRQQSVLGRLPVRMPDLEYSHVTELKGQYHAIFSNTLKIEKTLFG